MHVQSVRKQPRVYDDGRVAVRRHRSKGAPRILDSLRADERAAVATATLPILLGTAGLALIAAGAITGLIPLIVLGAGTTLFGFAMFATAEKVLRDRSRQATANLERASHRKQREILPPGEESEWKSAVIQPRSPLADAAVEVLTAGATTSAPTSPTASLNDVGQIHPPIGASAPRTRHDLLDHEAEVTFTSASSSATSSAPGHRGMTVGGSFADNVTRAVDEPVTFHSPGQAVQTPAFNAGSPGPLLSDERQEATPVVLANGTPVRSANTMAAPPAPRDHRAWPGQTESSRWGDFSGAAPSKPKYDAEAAERRIRERRAQMAQRLPVIGGMLDPSASTDGGRPDDKDADKTRGKCSRCSSIIWAPAKRPIVLKCPGCGHKAKLY